MSCHKGQNMLWVLNSADATPISHHLSTRCCFRFNGKSVAGSIMLCTGWLGSLRLANSSLSSLRWLSLGLLPLRVPFRTCPSSISPTLFESHQGISSEKREYDCKSRNCGLSLFEVQGRKFLVRGSCAKFRTGASSSFLRCSLQSIESV